MKIVVCIKQVPGTHNVSIDPETKRLKREGVEAIINPFDTYALEEAVLLKEAHGGEVVALSMGPPKAEQTLREAISCGADHGILLSDRALGGSDTWATSYALAMTIEKIGGVDLVICGKQAIDGDTAQVGPGIAAHLGWPQAAYVSSMEDHSTEKVTVKRMHEEGFDVCEVMLPAVITVVKDINSPRIPSLKNRMAAKKAEIPVWKAEDIGVDPEKIGLSGSPTRVVKASAPPARDKHTTVLDGEPEEIAAKLIHELRLHSFL
jgi:electron transfer flavoprotein beta subunit